MYPVLKLIFDYDTFSDRKTTSSGKKYSAFNLVKEIGLKTCPYCNRQFITVLEKKRISKGIHDIQKRRPALDHFYPRSRYPIFGISFYNLIPSCSFCNSSFKRDEDTTTERYIHPYEEGYSNFAKFKFTPTTNNSKVKMSIKLEINEIDKKKKKRITKTARLFKINEIYQNHSDLAQEIYEKSLKNSKGQADSVKKIIRTICKYTTTEEEFYKFYFGNYKNEEDFEKRPLAKFTSDLVDELQIMRLYSKQ